MAYNNHLCIIPLIIKIYKYKYFELSFFFFQIQLKIIKKKKINKIKK